MMFVSFFFFFKQKTSYEMRISDWSSDVCSSDLRVDAGRWRHVRESPVTKAASTLDYRTLAKRRLPHFLFEYIDGGSYDEVTLKRNVADLRAIALRQRVLTDASGLDLSTELFGQNMALPVALAPIAIGRDHV